MEKISKKIVDCRISKEIPRKEHYRSVPERPKTLQSETKKIKLDTGDGVKNAYITVSFYAGSRDPYEVFINTPIGNNLKDLQILELSARMTSLALRHGVPVNHIVNQLNKIDGQYIYSIPANLAKALQSYIPKEKHEEESNNEIICEPEEMSDEELDRLILGEDSVETGVAGTSCPKCKKNAYIMQEGCGRCLSCGYSGCS